jgi:hypothetical protein
MFQPGANSSAELFFEERDLFDPMVEAVVNEPDDDEDEDTGIEVDDLLEDDIDDDFEEKGIIKDLKKSIKISDEDTSIDDA